MRRRIARVIMWVALFGVVSAIGLPWVLARIATRSLASAGFAVDLPAPRWRLDTHGVGLVVARLTLNHVGGTIVEAHEAALRFGAVGLKPRYDLSIERLAVLVPAAKADSAGFGPESAINALHIAALVAHYLAAPDEHGLRSVNIPAFSVELGGASAKVVGSGRIELGAPPQLDLRAQADGSAIVLYGPARDGAVTRYVLEAPSTGRNLAELALEPERFTLSADLLLSDFPALGQVFAGPRGENVRAVLELAGDALPGAERSSFEGFFKLSGTAHPVSVTASGEAIRRSDVYALEFDAGTLLELGSPRGSSGTGAAGPLGLSVDKPGGLHCALSRVELSCGGELAAALPRLAFGKLAIEPLALQLALQALTVGSDSSDLRFAASGDDLRIVSGELRSVPLAVELHGQAALDAKDKLTTGAEGTLTHGGERLLSLQFSSEGGDLDGTFRLGPLQFTGERSLLSFIESEEENWDVTSGTLFGEGRFTGEAAAVADGVLEMRGLNGRLGPAVFQSLDMRAPLRFDNGAFSSKDAVILSISSVDFGVIAEKLRIVFELPRAGSDKAPARPSKLRLKSGEAELLGAAVRVQPGWIALDGKSGGTTVELAGLRIERVLEVYPQERLRGTGTLDGVLPLRLTDEGVVVEGGKLEARDGGVLQYTGTEDLAGGNEQLATAFALLEDLRYTSLAADVAYDAAGLLKLAVRIHGSNPQWQRGRPVDFAINIEENIPALLRSIQLARGTSDELQDAINATVERTRPRPGGK